MPNLIRPPTALVYRAALWVLIMVLSQAFCSCHNQRVLTSTMPKKGIPRRRRLAVSTRKRITSYYTVDEQQEITKAAASDGVSLSSFIASAALKEARSRLMQPKK